LGEMGELIGANSKPFGLAWRDPSAALGVEWSVLRDAARRVAEGSSGLEVTPGPGPGPKLCE
jgi:hypothetical protein